MNVHRTAVENAAAYDRRRGGKTMPADVRPVAGKPRVRGRRRIDRTPPRPKPKTGGLSQIILDGELFSTAFCRQVFDAYREGRSKHELAVTYGLGGSIIHAIITKGNQGTLTL